MYIDPDDKNISGWISQFHGNDRDLAAELLSNILYINADDFTKRIKHIINDLSKHYKEPFGLYVERKVRRYNGVPNKLFKEHRRKIKRAYGGGAPNPLT